VKKIFLIIFLAFLFLSLVPSSSQAALVPCGGTGQPACKLCHIFELLNNIFVFLLIPNAEINSNFPLIPTIAGLMLIIGGLYLLIAGASPELFSKAKSILTATVIGLVIVFVAYVFLNTFFMYIGVAKWTRLVPESGEAEGGGGTFLQDTDKNWENNEFVDFPVLITAGSGAGQPQKIIISNTDNTINISGTWSPPPGAGSKYNIGGNWFNIVCE